MTSIANPMCLGCKYLRGQGATRLRSPKCDAFPGGIPREIILSQADHRAFFSGDGGIRFAPKGAADAEYAEALFPAAK